MNDASVIVLGAGTMGTGISQLSIVAGLSTHVFDAREDALKKCKQSLERVLSRLVEKGKMTDEQRSAALSRLHFTSSLPELPKDASLAIEAIVEDLRVKRELFGELESLVRSSVTFATNTSSLAVGEIFSHLKYPNRCLGLHFFNPAPVLPLVEVVQSLQTDEAIVGNCYELMKGWGKKPVVTRDRPGFIVNRLARPFYGEALRIVEEGLATVREVDRCMRHEGGFRMGPFELMDLIGIDVNYAVSKTVFESFYCDPRYRPSLLQKEMVDAGLLGKKTGEGFYRYDSEGKQIAEGVTENLSESQDSEALLLRILSMLVNEACEAMSVGLASAEDLERAVVLGVNYPKGLLGWGDEVGAARVLAVLDALQARYGDMRYRPSVYLRDRAARGERLLPAREE